VVVGAEWLLFCSAVRAIGRLRYCCKSPFALAIKNFPGFRRDFRVKTWGTSSSDDKLADDLGNAIVGTRISDRRSEFFYSMKIRDRQFGTCQDRTHALRKKMLFDTSSVRARSVNGR
jgi:hypothetical protein